MITKPIRFSLAALATLTLANQANAAAIVDFWVDPTSTTRIFDNFNDGVDTATNFNNMSSLGEAGGFSAVTVPPVSADPQFQYLTPGAPFNASTHPFVRFRSQGSVDGGMQFFPLPPAGPTVVGFASTLTAVEQHKPWVNVAPGINGTGIRIDPIGGGNGNDESWGFDYIHLDQFETVGLGEFDRDDGFDGWAANPHIPDLAASASTSMLTGTTAGNDPTITVGGLNFDTAVYDMLEISLALDPASSSRFQFFWGTNLAGLSEARSVVLNTADGLIRDGNLHTYRFRMSDTSEWADNLTLFRIDPFADADAVDGKTFGIGHVRLLSGAPIPEPSTVTLAALAGLGLLVRRRRRK